jgi:F-type H+-transporting ATPase subunit a
MASDILHIKDSFYFEVPKALWRKGYKSPQEFYEAYGPWVIRNNEDYQNWEAERIVEGLKKIVKEPKKLDGLIDDWKHWQHEKHSRTGRPIDQFLDDEMERLQRQAAKWGNSQTGAQLSDVTQAFLSTDQNAEYPYGWMYEIISEPGTKKQWIELRNEFDSAAKTEEYLATPNLAWSASDVESYNNSLSGKIFIPQPFATLRNAYEVQSGFGITRYMIVEVVVALLMIVLFKWLAGKISTGTAPQGRVWNLLESMVLFVRNKIVVPAMGEHDADHYMPLMWTLFFFILGCNLMGMIPWVGAPTSVFAVTGILAFIIFAIGLVQGVRKFGVIGYLKNLAPSLGLPIYLAIFIVPLVWVIEALSLFIKHGVLAVRLLANMVAGHLVLLGFMGIAFGAHAVTMSTGSWGMAAVISVVASTLLSFLELFVACLQAYIFTFLASLFISTSTHHH